jgi:hypothetical protein
MQTRTHAPAQLTCEARRGRQQCTSHKHNAHELPVPGGIGAHGHAAATGRVDDDACDTSVAESSERVPAQQAKQLKRSCRLL